MQPELESFLQTNLESPAVVADRTWRDGARPLVLEVTDRASRTWYVKRNPRPEQYRAELTAYRRWTPALGDRAPRLHASDDELQALIITAVPGISPQDWQDSELQHQAGRLLRTFHDAESFRRYDEVIAHKLDQLERAAARGIVEPHAVDYARAQLKALDGIPAPLLVPCHLDFSPRNWLCDRGRLYVIDFGDAKPDAWVNDFGRLFIGWRLPSEPKDALLDGYGRRPSADDLALLRASYTVTLISHIVFAREHGYAQAEAAFREVLDGLMSGEIR